MKTDERSLVEAEKAELLTDMKPNIVPIRSWDVDRLICHAQSEADKAIEKLLSKSAPVLSAHIQGVVEDLRRLHAEMVFSASLRLLPVSWPFRGVGGFCLMILYFGMIACCVFGALLCGLAWLRLTSVGI